MFWEGSRNSLAFGTGAAAGRRTWTNASVGKTGQTQQHWPSSWAANSATALALVHVNSQRLISQLLFLLLMHLHGFMYLRFERNIPLTSFFISFFLFFYWGLEVRAIALLPKWSGKSCCTSQILLWPILQLKVTMHTEIFSLQKEVIGTKRSPLCSAVKVVNSKKKTKHFKCSRRNLHSFKTHLFPWLKLLSSLNW